MFEGDLSGEAERSDSSETPKLFRVQEVAEFEMKYASRIDDDAKILALKLIMSERLW